MKTVTDKELPQESIVAFLSKRLWRAALICMFLNVIAVAPQAAQAQCGVNSFHGITPRKNDAPSVVHVGDTVTATGQLINNADDCQDSWVVTNAFIILFSSSVPPGCAPTNIPVTIPGVSNVVLIDTNPPTRMQTVMGIRIPAGGTISATGTFRVPECDGRYSVLFNKF